MKLKDFDFRIWDNIEKKYLNRYPTIVRDNEDGILVGRSSRFYSSTADMFIENTNKDFEIELWTGLYDINDKKIYEGDILEIFDCEDGYIVVKVEFIKGDGFFYVKNDGEKINHIKDKEPVIVGNIHENAEILNIKGV